jgi:hypothetical protein
MPHPPAVRTQIGYHRWWSDEYGACGIYYYVLPDGAAEIVRQSEADGDEVEKIPAGEWEVVYPVTTFGSRGGCWVERKNLTPAPSAEPARY